MSRPAKVDSVDAVIHRLLDKRLPGKRSGVHRRMEEAKRVARALFSRWGIGPYQWQLKHLKWYLDIFIAALAAQTRYDQWLAIQTVLDATGKAHLASLLKARSNAGYVRPTGEPGALHDRRPRKRPR
jgi:hypothetical protein